jgi:hypothetical protein
MNTGLLRVICCRAVKGIPWPAGHKDVQTTMVHTHVLNRGGRGGLSALEVLQKAVSIDGGIRPTGRSA